MAQLVASTIRRRRRLLGLFEEAWRRQRRRRRVCLALIVVAALAAVVVLVRGRAPTPNPVASPPAVLARLSSGALPAVGDYASLTQVDGRLIAAGGPGEQPLNASGAVTTLTGGRATGRCVAATVAPGTVRLDRPARANCGDPALYGLHAIPIMYLEAPRERGIVGVRIAVSDPSALDGYRLGPILTTYPQCSDCAAQWVAGDGALWISAAFADHTRGAGEILRVSARTGSVLQRFAMPRLVHALLAVDRDGLWVAPSIETGVSGGRPSAVAVRAASSLYLVAPGARRASAVLGVGNGIPWLTAAGHRVWLDERADGADRMLTFTGTSAQRRRVGPRQRVGDDAGGELGDASVPYAADAATGVDGVVTPDSGELAVVSYRTATLTERVLATAPRPDAFYQQPDAVALGDSLYFLDAQLPLGSGSIPARLYRLALDR